MTATAASKDLAPQPPESESGRTPARIVYHRIPHPFREGDLVFFDAAATEEALIAANRGAPVVRIATAPREPPDETEVRRFEARLRRRFLARARAARGWSFWWWFAGPALTLLWINFAGLIAALVSWLPPLEALIGSLGAIVGGMLLATIVALLPLTWAWRRAVGNWREAARWSRLAGALARRRYRQSPLERGADPTLAGFVDASAPTVAQLRALLPDLVDRGVDGAAEAVHLCRALYRLAVQHRLPDVASAYHTLYRRFDAAEQRLIRLERGGGGVLAERKAAGELQRTRREAGAVLASFSPTDRAGTNLLAPAAGIVLGAATLGLVLLLTGLFWVEPDQAVIVDPFPARLARLAGAAGQTTDPVFADLRRTVEIVREPGFHWGLPLPFASRHAVTVGEQRTQLRAIVRQTGPDSYDVAFVEIRFRITDLERWAQRDRQGEGVARLSSELSAVLQNVIQRARGEAGQVIVQQNPSLADDPAQLAMRADQFVIDRLPELIRAYVDAVGSAGVTREAGVQVSREHRFQLITGVPGAVAGAQTLDE